MKVIILITIILILFFILQEKNKKITEGQNENQLPINEEIKEEINGAVETIKEIIEPVKEKEVPLKDVLHKMSSADKVVLNNIVSKWSLNKNLIDSITNENITNIIQKIIESIGYFSKNDYYIKTIENMYVMKDKKNNFRCIVNFFIYDVKNYHTVKLIIDFVSFEDIIYINFIDIDKSGIKNTLQKYSFKYKSQGILNYYDTFDEDIQVLLDTYYTDKFKIIPLRGRPDTVDVSSVFTLYQLTQKMLPANIPIKDGSPFFCDKESLIWDTKSLPVPRDEDCMFNNPSIQQYPSEPSNIPGTIINNVDTNEYSWLNDPVERV
tara:strand:+ start:1691 stop:2656 length:966 start_codon:yes stop_codon:yes gene_type:complete